MAATRAASELRIQNMLIRVLDVLRYADADELEDFGFEEKDAQMLRSLTHVGDMAYFVTRDKGLELQFADGSRWTMSIGCYERPDLSGHEEGKTCPECGIDGEFEEGEVCPECEAEQADEW